MVSKFDPKSVCYFASSAELRNWFLLHHANVSELWIGYFRKNSPGFKNSISYEESVREALCFGWIDGVCKKIDDARYCNRYTPRRIKTSNWSAPNLQRYQELLAENLVHPAGVTAYEGRRSQPALAIPADNAASTKRSVQDASAVELPKKRRK
jgi:uncharacterized protein YdeI (YjbR/CyaY-like superfamily)